MKNTDQKQVVAYLKLLDEPAQNCVRWGASSILRRHPLAEAWL